VDALELAIAMYIVISLIVHGPDIEKAAGTIREIIRDACSRIEKGDKVPCGVALSALASSRQILMTAVCSPPW
jgi:hypothetical protein